MRVHTRYLLIISAVILAISLAYGIGAQYFLIGGIQEIETKEITDDLTRAATSIDHLATDLAVFSKDYAMWDDTAPNKNNRWTAPLSQVTVTDDSGSKGFVRRASEKRYG